MCAVVLHQVSNRDTRGSQSKVDSGQLDQLKYENDRLKIALAQRLVLPRNGPDDQEQMIKNSFTSINDCRGVTQAGFFF